jgi:hypothetical protein
MSSSIRPDELTIRLDEFAKYAPRWSREGKPKYAMGLPPAPQLARMNLGEPVWRRGPSPFEDEIQQPHVLPMNDPYADTDTRIFVSGRVDVGLVEGLLSTAAVMSLGAIAMVGLGLVLSPKAPTHGQSILEVASAQAATVSQREKVKPVGARFGVQDLWPTEPTPWTAQAPTKAPDSTPAASAAPAAARVTNAMYVVASADPSSLPAPRAQQQLRPDPQPSVEPQPQQNAAAPSAPTLAPQAAQTQHVLSPDTIESLINRGEAFLAQGDVATARVLLERAAEARDPRAALALGSTYDPNVLRRMGTVGIRPDQKQASVWYERAAEFGSGEASQRLTALAQR